MPYSVPPPPPPAVVEVQFSVADQVDSVRQLSVDAAADDRQVGDSPEERLRQRPPSSAATHWPSLLSAPDVFAHEFSGRSAIAPGTPLDDYDDGASDASLLWGTFGIGDGSGTSASGLPDTATHSSITFTTTPLPSLTTSASEPLPSNPVHALSSSIPSSARESARESAVAFSELDPSDPDLSDLGLSDLGLSDSDEVSDDVARRATQMRDDLKSLATELLLPLEDTIAELYALAQQAEQAALESSAGTDIVNLSAPVPRSQFSPVQTDAESSVEEPARGFFDDEGFGPLDPDIDPDPVSPERPLAPDQDADDALDIPPDPVPTEPIPVEPLPPGDRPNESLDDARPDAPFDELNDAPLDDEVDETLDNGFEDVPPPDADTDLGDELDDALDNQVTPAQPVSPANAGAGDVIELTADRQIYDTQRRVFIAEGDVELLFRGAVLNADRVQVNLPNKIVVAAGDVFFSRGEQVLQGDRIEYNLVLEEGRVVGARGEVFLPGVSSDVATTRTDAVARADAPPPSDQLARDQPPIETATTVGGLTLGGTVGSQGGLQGGAGLGEVRQVRFEADVIDFYPEGWEASNVRITNDPFSPPELELRASTATFSRLSPTRSELVVRRPRLVFDQGLAIPLLRRRFIFDENRRNSALLQFGYDETDRGGLFAERAFEVITSPVARLTLTPQIYLQRWYDQEPDNDLDEFSLRDAFGFKGDLTVNIDPRTTLDGQTEFTSLDFTDFENEVRGSVRINREVLPITQPFSNRENFHTLTAEYSYRDRLFNGTLGFQTVQETYGLVLTSPTIRITDDDIYGQGLDLRYQAAIQRVNSNLAADAIEDILGPPPWENGRATLNRYQIAANLRRFFFLWAGTPLPATPEEGLRYTPAPVVPYIGIIPSIQGITSFYESGDVQPILTGEVTLQGQFGHFSRPYLDYLGFGLTYRRSTEGSESPFTFDRLNDREVFSANATAQLYGPLRIGIRTSISLDQNQEFDNSYFLEYSRRTYGVVLNYNPDREIGSLGLRLSDFNWTGATEPFDTPRNRDAEPSDMDTPEPDDSESDIPESDAPESDALEPDAPEPDALEPDAPEPDALNDALNTDDSSAPDTAPFSDTDPFPEIDPTSESHSFPEFDPNFSEPSPMQSNSSDPNSPVPIDGIDIDVIDPL